MQIWQKAEEVIYDYFSSRKDCHIIRLRDTHDINAQLRRFGEKPLIIGKKRESDFIVIENGSIYFAEVKCTSQIRGVTSNLFASQEGKRNRILRAKGDYRYFVYSMIKESWYCIPADVIYRKARRSWDELEQYKIYYLEKIPCEI